jgi:hypothetical protein
MPCFVTSSPKTISVLILPLEMPFGDLRQVRAHFGETNSGEPRAVRVRIFVRADEQLVAFANARDGIADAPSLDFNFEISQSSSFVCRAEATMATEPAGAFSACRKFH